MIENLFITIGILVIFLGFVLIFIGAFLQGSKTKTEAGFVTFIGPIPIGFVSSKNMFYITILISIIVSIIILILTKGIFS